MRPDETDRDEMWCAVELRPKHRKMLNSQCEHTTSGGRYAFVNRKGAVCVFDPASKIQALAWVNKREERRRRILWLCFQCDCVMPLGSYDADSKHA